MQRLANKVALITASTDGIGLAIAKRLRQEGAHVVISSRKQANVDKALNQLSTEVSSSSKLIGLTCHVGVAEDRSRLITETVSKLGKIDFLVSNAGTNPAFGPMLDTSEEAWDKLFDTNVKSTFFLTKAAVPHMNKNSSIIFVSSIGAYVPIPFIGSYCVTKTALLGLVKGLSSELGPEGIRVNGIAPGIIQTKFSQALVNDPSTSEHVIQMTHLKRLGEVDDCAGTVAFLCSSDSSYITGEIICITGGLPSRL